MKEKIEFLKRCRFWKAYNNEIVFKPDVLECLSEIILLELKTLRQSRVLFKGYSPITGFVLKEFICYKDTNFISSLLLSRNKYKIELALNLCMNF